MACSSSPYAQLEPSALFFRPPTLDDLDRIHEIEASSYPQDEAATLEKLRFRITEAPGQFLVAVQSTDLGAADEVIGYACGTCSTSSSLTHESMSCHEPDGPLLCVHSVAVAAPHRRRGVATRLLSAYLRYVQGTTPALAEVRLICKQGLVPLYERAGFALLGESSVVHGADTWYEMAGGGGAGQAAEAR